MTFSIQWLEKRGITAPAGFQAGAARAGIKTEGDDVALVLAAQNSSAAAVFTTNQVKAAPVLLSAAHLASNPRAIIVNAGNANCCTGARGLENARQMTVLAAHKLGIAPEQVFVCSTGIIGHQLPVEKIETALQSLVFDGETKEITLEPGDEGALFEALEAENGVNVAEREADIDEREADVRESGADIDESGADIGESGADFGEREADIDEREADIDEREADFGESGADSEAIPNRIGQGEAIDEAVARAFMTTDTVPKFCAASLEIGGKTVTVGGQAKGVGMIGPNMAPLTLHATLLAFLTTDAQIERVLLQRLLERAVGKSFNSVTVDGDTSTNDTAILLASGESGCVINEGNAALFSGLLDAVCIELGKKIARDGEGATKLVEIRVKGARREEGAKKIALTIANSPLVKTALFGKDPNWGRIAMAAGKAGVEFDAGKLSFSLGDVEMFRDGEPVDFDLKAAETVLEPENVLISLDLGDGSASWTAWTCDFSYDYVKINAEYHT